MNTKQDIRDTPDLAELGPHTHQITHGLNGADELIEQLGKTITELADGLSPVMLNREYIDDTEKEQDENLVPLAVRIHAINHGLRRINRDLSRMIESLEI